MIKQLISAEKTGVYGSVQKAIGILLAFVPQNKEMGTLELSEKLGLHKSTVSRLLHVLTQYELVRQDSDTKKYTLGKSAAAIGRSANRSLSSQLISIARTYCDDLRDAIDETVGLEVMSGKSTMLAYSAEGTNIVTVTFKVGEFLPVHVAAGAKAILAFSPPETVDRLIKGNLRRFNSNTITKQGVFKRLLREIKQNGIAFDNGEYSSDLHAIASPVFNNQKKPIAALVMSAPAYRVKSLKEPSIISLLKETASKISARLLYSDEAD